MTEFDHASAGSLSHSSTRPTGEIMPSSDIRSFALILLELLAALHLTGYERNIPCNHKFKSEELLSYFDLHAGEKKRELLDKKTIHDKCHKDVKQTDISDVEGSTSCQHSSVISNTKCERDNLENCGYISMNEVRANKLFKRPLPPVPVPSNRNVKPREEGTFKPTKHPNNENTTLTREHHQNGTGLNVKDDVDNLESILQNPQRKTAVVRPIPICAELINHVNSVAKEFKDSSPDDSLESGFVTGGSGGHLSGTEESDPSSVLMFRQTEKRKPECKETLMSSGRQSFLKSNFDSKSENSFYKHPLKNVISTQNTRAETEYTEGSIRDCKLKNSIVICDKGINKKDQYPQNSSTNTSLTSLYASNVSLTSINSDKSRNVMKKAPSLGVSAIKYRQSKLSLNSVSSVTDTEHLPARPSTDIHPPFGEIASIDLKAVGHSPETNYQEFHLQMCREIKDMYDFIDVDNVWSRNIIHVKQMLEAMAKSDRLGYVALQVVTTH